MKTVISKSTGGCPPEGAGKVIFYSAGLRWRLFTFNSIYLQWVFFEEAAPANQESLPAAAAFASQTDQSSPHICRRGWPTGRRPPGDTSTTVAGAAAPPVDERGRTGETVLDGERLERS